MVRLIVLLGFLFVSNANADDYTKAYTKLKDSDGVLVVFVCADNCPGCVHVKGLLSVGAIKLLDALEKESGTDYSTLVEVNLDKEPDLGQLIVPGATVTIPQVHVFIKRKGTWLPRRIYIGPEKICSLLK